MDEAAVTGRWKSVLTAIGIDDKFLDGEHRACPLCGGEDRFRFDDIEGRGTYYCNSCGPGTGIKLVKEWLGCDYKQAYRQVAKVLGEVKPQRDKEKVFEPKRSIENIRQGLIQAWSSAKDPGIVLDYLRSRSINTDLKIKDLRGAMRMPYYVNGSRVGNYPAMVALVRNADGEPITLHRTYIISEITRKKKVMTPLEKMTGGYIELAESSNGIVVYGEGIETALAGREFMTQMYEKFHHAGVRSVISANNLRAQKLNDKITDVVICVDQDHSFTGQAVSFLFAKECKDKKKRVTVLMPSELGMDMVDVLSGRCGAMTYRA